MAPLTTENNGTKRQIKKRKIDPSISASKPTAKSTTNSTDDAVNPINPLSPTRASTGNQTSFPTPTPYLTTTANIIMETPSTGSEVPSMSVLPTSASTSITPSTTAEPDPVNIAISSFKPFIVPTVLVILGFCLLTFLCCCVRWSRFNKNKKVNSLENEKSDNENLTAMNGGNPAVIICGGAGNHRCSNCGTTITDESEGSEDNGSDESEWENRDDKRKSGFLILPSSNQQQQQQRQKLTAAKNKNLDNSKENSKIDRRVSFKINSKDIKRPKSNKLGIEVAADDDDEWTRYLKRLASNSPSSQSVFTEIVETEADNKPNNDDVSSISEIGTDPNYLVPTDVIPKSDESDESSKSASSSPLQNNDIPSLTINADNDVQSISSSQREIPSSNNLPTLRASSASGSSVPIAVLRPTNSSTTSLIMQQNNIYASRTLVFPLPPKTNHNS
ncbi:6881_t:CDS:2 [Ambispora leptoticha]|uniref:6881_t:CDS:1 n=1 Tax=Ambispora leptoticha TaxID=144679 RepID=A0A9N9G8T0_9GLOM|nr:6881_t:CDS:2 [Ambispora leptoticha]